MPAVIGGGVTLLSIWFGVSSQEKQIRKIQALSDAYSNLPAKTAAAENILRSAEALSSTLLAQVMVKSSRRFDWNNLAAIVTVAVFGGAVTWGLIFAAGHVVLTWVRFLLYLLAGGIGFTTLLLSIVGGGSQMFRSVGEPEQN